LAEPPFFERLHHNEHTRRKNCQRYAGPLLLLVSETTCAAASMLRPRSNCGVMLVLQSELVELIELTPTAEAIVSGLAPARPAPT
jgi:hypothetical protein